MDLLTNPLRFPRRGARIVTGYVGRGTTVRNARTLREQRGLSLRDVEHKIGMDHSSIARFEEGRFMREEHLIAYAALLEVDWQELCRPADTVAGGEG